MSLLSRNAALVQFIYLPLVNLVGKLRLSVPDRFNFFRLKHIANIFDLDCSVYFSTLSVFV